MSGFDSEYKLIRKMLVALLCVGDEVKCVHRWSPMDSTYVISRYIVSNIDSDGKVYIQSVDGLVRCPIHAIEHHNGQLYFFEDSNFAYTHKARMKKLFKLIENYGRVLGN